MASFPSPSTSTTLSPLSTAASVATSASDSTKPASKDAELEVESERTKQRTVAAQFNEFKSQLSDARKLIIYLKEELLRERMALEQQTQEIISLRKELQEKELDCSGSENLLQVKESGLVEAMLKIQEVKSELDIVQLILQEKDADRIKVQKALAEVHSDIAVLQKLMNSKEQQLIQACMRLSSTQRELDDAKIKFCETVSVMDQLDEQLEEETPLPEIKQE